METEKRLIEYVLDSKFEELPKKPVDIVRTVVLAVVGGAIAGATNDGVQKLVDLVKECGGKQEATILLHGGKVPSCNAALANGTMARVMDFEDAMLPGIHIGPVAVPAGLAAAELVGGCSGKEFLTSLILGIELACRLNRMNFDSNYGGFDPIGVCAIFAGTATAGRILNLNHTQMLNALALAFNRAGGSAQSNIDGAQSVGFIAGSAAESSIICSQLAQRGVTGPKNFLGGPCGFFHLYARDKFDANLVAGELGRRFELTNTKFKKYPSCGLTQSDTQTTLELVNEEGLTPENVASIDIRVQPYKYKLVGKPFEIGDSPRVNAQFSTQYCVANALLRKSSQLIHFEEEYIRESEIMEIVKKIKVTSDPALEKRVQTAVDMEVRTKQGAVYRKSIDSARGSPGNELTREEHIASFQDCVNYCGKPLPKKNPEKIISMVDKLAETADIRDLIALLLS